MIDVLVDVVVEVGCPGVICVIVVNFDQVLPTAFLEKYWAAVPPEELGVEVELPPPQALNKSVAITANNKCTCFIGIS